MKLAAKTGKAPKEEACKKQKTGRSSSRKRTGAAIDEVLSACSRFSSLAFPCIFAPRRAWQHGLLDATLPIDLPRSRCAPRISQEMAAGEGNQKEKKSDEDSVDEELARVTANLATKRKTIINDESQRTISALLEQSRRTQRGLMQQASESEAARGDVSACGEETQAEEDVRMIAPRASI
jgi:hypothetical protein